MTERRRLTNYDGGMLPGDSEVQRIGNLEAVKAETERFLGTVKDAIRAYKKGWINHMASAEAAAVKRAALDLKRCLTKRAR